MSTSAAVASSPSSSPSSSRTDRDRGPSFGRVLWSEWVRFRSLRSTWITLAVSVVIAVGFGALISFARVSHWPPDPGEILTFDPTRRSLGAGVFFGQLVIGVLGVLLVTGEYSTGMIRATFGAVPHRVVALVARLVVFVTAAVVVLVPTMIVAFLVGQEIFATKHINTTLGAPDVLRAVIGGALYVVAIGVLGMALGWLLRHTAGAIATLFGLIFILPIILNLLPTPWPDRLVKWFPGVGDRALGTALWAVRPADGALSPWAGFGMLVAYIAGLLVIAALLLRARDV